VTATLTVPGLFDPPTGIKVFDDSGLPLLRWTMTWINSTNLFAVRARVSDPIPAGTTYSDTYAGTGSWPGGVPLPLPSTIVGVSCTTPPLSVTTTDSCYYEGPSVTYPLGRVVWEGTLGPDDGHNDAASAVNELYITFNVTVPSDVRTAYNVATVDTDRNGDGTYIASEERLASIQALWALREPGGERDRGGARAKQLPVTGFAPGVVTILPKLPADKAYFDTGSIWLEIPRLGVRASIEGIPQADDGTWDVSWLWQQAGWLQGTAYPTGKGNSAITGHVYLPNGKPGPFVDVNKLAYGNKIIVHAYGQKYTYEVRENKQVRPNDVSVLKHEDKAWLTLLTCLGYDESNNTYASRVAIRAVLMTVTKDTTSTPNKDR
jgi:LPXTG-site transpeptidase (sortase) family protein